MRMELGHLVLRADAGVRIGIGHVMRCLALAQAWQDQGGAGQFVLAGVPNAIEARLTDENMLVSRIAAEPGSDDDAGEVVGVAKATGAKWVVIDGYHFGTRYQRRLKDAGLKVLAIDDYGHAGHYAADLVLNQNLYAAEALYRSCEPHTRLLLGLRYALLRREFRQSRERPRQIPEVARNVLVTLGGSDPDNVTGKVVEALKSLRTSGLEAVVVAGGSNPNIGALEVAVQGFEDAIRLRTDVSNMPSLMAWADVAIAAGGSSSWERAFLGLPSLIIVLAENQVDLARSCATAGLGLNLGWHHSLTPVQIADALAELVRRRNIRAAMADRGPSLVDGGGAARVIEALTAGGPNLRRVQIEDCRLLWEWANEAVVRAMSFNPMPISWDDHVLWFRHKLADPACLFFIAHDIAGTPIGQARCDLSASVATVSIGLARQSRGKDYSYSLIRQMCERAFAEATVSSVVALIRPENEPSRRAFQKASFVEDGTDNINGLQAIRMVYRR